MESKRQQNIDPCLKHRLMVIDDDPIILENMTNYLKDSGYEVLTAVNNNDALASFLAVNPELVLCTISDSALKDISLIKTMINKRPLIPIIVISAVGQLKVVIEALRLGVSDYLIKPITNFEEFDTTIQSVLFKYA